MLSPQTHKKKSSETELPLHLFTIDWPIRRPNLSQLNIMYYSILCRVVVPSRCFGFKRNKTIIRFTISFEVRTTLTTTTNTKKTTTKTGRNLLVVIAWTQHSLSICFCFVSDTDHHHVDIDGSFVQTSNYWSNVNVFYSMCVWICDWRPNSKH